MIFTQHITDRRRALAKRLIIGQIIAVHRIQNAAMHRLQPVAHIGKCAGDNYAHCIFNERFLHIFFDLYRHDLLIGKGNVLFVIHFER